MWASPGVAAAVQDRVCPPVPPYESEVKEHQWAVPTPCCSQGRAGTAVRAGLLSEPAPLSKGGSLWLSALLCPGFVALSKWWLSLSEPRSGEL